MPGPDHSIAPSPSGAGLAVFSGYIRPGNRSQTAIDRACATLARTADNIDEIAAYVGEVAREADQSVNRVQILLDSVRARG